MSDITHLTFHPLLRETLWGGQRIAPMKGLTVTDAPIGESWELSCVAGHESVVCGGAMNGRLLSDVIAEMGPALVGGRCWAAHGSVFPLLVKLIDARQDLSIQVHPDDTTAQRHGLPCGKTEMWYVLDAAHGAHIYSGLQSALDPAEFRRRIREKTITTTLARHTLRRGDVFYIPAGRIHSIGAGCLVAEIQQTSDVTYRIYDFDRRDSEGRPRQLHVEEAVECIDWHVESDYRTHYDASPDSAVTLVRSPYFHTRLLTVEDSVSVDCRDTDSFIILMVTGGEGTLSVGGEDIALKPWQTLLLPATTTGYTVSGHTALLEVTYP